MADDNSGGIAITGATRDVVVEDCIWRNPLSTIRIEKSTEGVLFRNNTFAGAVPDKDTGNDAAATNTFRGALR